MTSLSLRSTFFVIWKRVKRIRGKSILDDPPLVLQIDKSAVSDAKSFATAVSSSDAATMAFHALCSVVEGHAFDFTSGGGEPYTDLFHLLRDTLDSCRDTIPDPDDIPYAMP